MRPYTIRETATLYCLATTFKTLTKISDETEAFLDQKKRRFDKLTSDEKLYYSRYAIRIVQRLVDYLENITLFDINDEPENYKTVHDFRLHWGTERVANICLSISPKNILIRDIIPIKLMRCCGYTKKTKVAKSYYANYRKFSARVHRKFEGFDKFSEIKEEDKDRIILKPLNDLLVTTLSRRKKCTGNLYRTLFGERHRLVIRLNKSRFTLYDFSVKSQQEVVGFRMKKLAKNVVRIKFSNGAIFALVPITNSTHIKENLSLKFKTKFVNLNDMFAISCDKI